jgi:hypothetical protein
MSKIKFDPISGFAVMPVRIKKHKLLSHEPPSDADFKVDTGASSSTISIEALRGFGYDDDWVRKNGRELIDKERPLGFSGEYVNGMYEIHLPHVVIGLNHSFKCRFMTRLNAPLEARPMQLLLGMDILSNFNWSFNFDENEFSFTYRRHPNISTGTKRRTEFHSVDEGNSQ